MSGAHRTLPTERMLKSYPCDRATWTRLHAIGQEMIRGGATCDVTPLRAYQHQRFRAGKRGIEWRITLAEWWSVWEQSGNWDQRGAGRGFMMCRVGDSGAYEVGNVYIGPGTENLSAATKKSDLPIGVARAGTNKINPYRAYCNVGGKQRFLGVFPTPEEAHREYLRARQLDAAIKQNVRDAA